MVSEFIGMLWIIIIIAFAILIAVVFIIIVKCLSSPSSLAYRRVHDNSISNTTYRTIPLMIPSKKINTPSDASLYY